MSLKHLNIGFIAGFNTFPPKRGAMIHAHYIAKNLTKLGHAIHVFDYEKNPAYKKYPNTITGLEKMIRNVDVFYVRIHGFPDNDEFTIRLAKLAPQSLIFWEINAPLEELEPILKSDAGKLKNDAYKHTTPKDLPRLIENRKQAAKLVSAASCVSQEMARYAKEELGIQNSHYVPNGSDPELFSHDKKDDSIYKIFRDKIKILWAGSTQYPWHGLSLIYEAAKLLTADDRFVFILIGAEKYFPEHTHKNIAIINSVNYDEMPRLVASSDICLCVHEPCEWSPYGFYFSPIKLFDYMACAKPVIASNMGELGRIIKHKDNGVLTSNDPEDLARQILALAENENRRNAIGEAARKDVVRFYNWERAARQTEKILMEMA